MAIWVKIIRYFTIIEYGVTAFINSIQLSSLFPFSQSSILAFGLPSDIASVFSPWLGEVYWEGVYIAATFVIGVLIAYQAIVLKHNQGKLPTTVAFNLASIFETIWFMVSAGLLYFANVSLLPKVVAIAYIIYGIMGWVYSFYLLKDEDIELTDIEDMAMPAKYMDYSLSFSLVIMLTCLAFLTMLYMQGKFSFV